ncbi:MAG: hypothetical protein R2713_12570 [Ilumatobacteraceae bacterium]
MTSTSTTRDHLHRIAVHIVARARIEASGRFSLRVTPGGFGTPELGPDGRRVRVSGAHLLVESDVEGSAGAWSTAIAGASLAQLAAFAGVDLSETIDVGHDTRPSATCTHRSSSTRPGRSHWPAGTRSRRRSSTACSPRCTRARRRRCHACGPSTSTSPSRHRPPPNAVNLGGSPGDASSDEPYLYVGPWTADRPGDPDFWNAPFGAMRTRSELAADPAGPVAAGVAFLLDGYHRLR